MTLTKKQTKTAEFLSYVTGFLLRVALWSFAFALIIMVLVGVLHGEMGWPIRTLSYHDAYVLAVLTNLLMRALLLA